MGTYHGQRDTWHQDKSFAKLDSQRGLRHTQQDSQANRRHQPAYSQNMRPRPQALSNLQSFFVHTSPCVPVSYSSEGLNLSYPQRTFFCLSDLWESLEEWSAFGAEVPLHVETGTEVVQCYAPSLSAIQIFEKDCFVQRCNPVAHDSDEESADSHSCIDSGTADTTSISSASSIATDSDSEDGKCPVSVHKGVRGSVLQKQMSVGEPRRTAFEYFEHASPHVRDPLTDTIKQLAEGSGEQSFPGLLTLRSCDIHPASWFAIAWYPLYRIPSTGRNLRDLGATFLTYHSLALPRRPLAYDIPDGSPHPPLPPPAAAAAYSRRKQDALQRHQQEVAILQPFAFTPYKLSGRTWIDDDNLQQRHIPMMAAATAWVQRHKVHHPDLTFFSQHPRQLPSNRR